MEDLGLQYWAITDHSKSSFQANGLDAKRLREQIQQIKQLNEKLATRDSDFRLLAGSEVDILKDRLDFDDDLLAELDVVVASSDLKIWACNIGPSRIIPNRPFKPMVWMQNVCASRFSKSSSSTRSWPPVTAISGCSLAARWIF